MSHFTRINTRIADLEALVRCLNEMGHEVHEGGTIRGFTGRLKVDIRVSLDRGYEIGFVRGDDGAYELVADWWGVRGTSREQFLRQLDGQFTRMQQEIRRQYALQTVLAKSREQGFDVVEQQEQRDGTVRVVVRRWS